MKYQPMLKTVLLITLMICFLTIAACQKTEEHTEASKYRKAPEINLKLITGEDRKLSDYKGKITVLNFWSPGCGACEAELPYLNNLYKKYQHQAVEIISINVGGTKEYVKKYFKKKDFNLKYPIAVDQIMLTTEKYSVQAIPTTFILDKEHNIRKVLTIIEDLEVIENHIKKLLN